MILSLVFLVIAGGSNDYIPFKHDSKKSDVIYVREESDGRDRWIEQVESDQDDVYQGYIFPCLKANCPRPKEE